MRTGLFDDALYFGSLFGYSFVDNSKLPFCFQHPNAFLELIFRIQGVLLQKKLFSLSLDVLGEGFKKHLGVEKIIILHIYLKSRNKRKFVTIDEVLIGGLSQFFWH